MLVDEEGVGCWDEWKMFLDTGHGNGGMVEWVKCPDPHLCSWWFVFTIGQCSKPCGLYREFHYPIGITA